MCLSTTITGGLKLCLVLVWFIGTRISKKKKKLNHVKMLLLGNSTNGLLILQIVRLQCHLDTNARCCSVVAMRSPE